MGIGFGGNPFCKISKNHPQIEKNTMEMKGKVNEVPVNGRERVTLLSHPVLQIFKGAKPMTESV